MTKKKESKRQNREDIVDRICRLAAVPREHKTPGYFSRNQLLNLVIFLERISKHEPDSSERN